jgi:hypothetical protein
MYMLCIIFFSSFLPVPFLSFPSYTDLFFYILSYRTLSCPVLSNTLMLPLPPPPPSPSQSLLSALLPSFIPEFILFFLLVLLLILLVYSNPSILSPYHSSFLLHHPPLLPHNSIFNFYLN